MKHLLLILSLVSFIFMFTGCGPKAPAEAEIQKKFIGAYCADGGTRLELYEDGSFFNSAQRKSPITKGYITEKCRGKYTLVLDEDKNEWRVEFAKSGTQGSLASCNGSRVLWNGETLYGANETSVTLEDLLERKPVTLGSCGGI